MAEHHHAGSAASSHQTGRAADPLADADASAAHADGPLAGIRVVEMCNTFAGPACCRMLADFGADIIKVEPLDGDPVRQMGEFLDGVSLQAISIQRGKRSLALDLKSPEGQRIFADLIERADVLVENNRPGVLERLGLGEAALRARNPGLVMVRISGYGQSGPYKNRPGYGAICEAFAGVRDLTGDPDRPPSRVALATTDYMTAVYAAFGAMMALFHRQRTGEGQVVDAALYEAAFSMMEGNVPTYQKLGILPKRQGGALPNVAPNNLYRTRDVYLLLAANNNATFERLARVMQRADLLDDARFATVWLRGQNAKALDALIEEWTLRHGSAELEALLQGAEIPCTCVNTLAEVIDDAHFKARDMLLEVAHPVLGSTLQVGIVPKLSVTPGRVRSVGPDTGAQSRAILCGELGLTSAAVDDLVARGIVGVIDAGGTAAAAG